MTFQIRYAVDHVIPWEYVKYDDAKKTIYVNCSVLHANGITGYAGRLEDDHRYCVIQGKTKNILFRKLFRSNPDDHHGIYTSPEIPNIRVKLI